MALVLGCVSRGSVSCIEFKCPRLRAIGVASLLRELVLCHQRVIAAARVPLSSEAATLTTDRTSEGTGAVRPRNGRARSRSKAGPLWLMVAGAAQARPWSGPGDNLDQVQLL